MVQVRSSSSLSILIIAAYVAAATVGLAVVFGLFYIFRESAIWLALAAFLLAVSYASPRYAWALYFISVTLTGVYIASPYGVIRLEFLAFPLFLLSLREITGRMSREYSIANRYRLWVPGAGISWVAVTLLASIFVALKPVSSVWITFQLAVGLAAFSLLVSRNDLKQSMIVTGTRVLGAISLLSLIGLILSVVVGPESPLAVGVADDGRLIGFSFEVNIFGAQCVAWLAVMYTWRTKLPRTTLYWAVPLIGAVILSGTRSAWIALMLLAVAASISSSTSRFSRFRLIYWILGVVGVLLFLVINGTNVTERGGIVWRFLNILNFSEGTGGYRFEIYSWAIAAIEGPVRILFGSGANSFSQYYLLDPTGVAVPYLSSIWLATFFDSGIVGFILFVVTIIYIIRNYEDARIGWIVPASILICSSATSVIWFAFAWVYMALVESKESSDRDLVELSNGSGSVVAVSRT